VKKSILIAILALSLFSLGTLVHAAAYTDGAAFYSGGYDDRSVYKNIKYYVPSDANTDYGKYIQDAISDYTSLGLNFGFSKTTSVQDADLMIFKTKQSPAYNGMPGIMLPCDWSGSNCNYVGYETFWDAATILLFSDWIQDNRLSGAQINKVVVHEFGHVYSLKHQDDKTVQSVMVTGEQVPYTSPTELDIANLKWRY